MKKILKRLLPESILLFYHYLVALSAAIYYNFPSKKMIVVGVTGTKGKTSTANFIWSCLTAGGVKTGIISTANMRIGEKEFPNIYHMTMPSPFVIQKLLWQMLKEGCTHAVVETTSEGLKQYRHAGIDYDIAVFTNLTPEHLPSHGGSFEKYRLVKSRMFQALSAHHKVLNKKKIEKIIIANHDSEHATYFLGFQADKKITYALDREADVIAEHIEDAKDGVSFQVGRVPFKLSILGAFNVANALPALIVARLFGVLDNDIARGLSMLEKIPGRMEVISEGQNFMVIVDYAHEKVSMTKVLQTAANIRKNQSKIIVLLGAEGGGRDKSKRPIIGDLAGRMADYVIVSNVDPYEDDPQEILEDIARSSERVGKIRNSDLFVIEDRREGIRKALTLAREGDIVLITGKGAEQSIVIGGKSSPWDDREIVREELRLLR